MDTSLKGALLLRMVLLGLVFLRLAHNHPIDSSSLGIDDLDREQIEPHKTLTLQAEKSIHVRDVHSQNSLNVNSRMQDESNKNLEKRAAFDPISYLNKYGYLSRTNQAKRGSLILYPPGWWIMVLYYVKLIAKSGFYYIRLEYGTDASK